jgi:acetyl-CoA synthetase
MTRGIWGDDDRYLQTYWSTYPQVWRHGDWSIVSETGQWYLLGRSDDTINVAGKRVAPAEIETVLVNHPEVRDAAVVGIPHPGKGESIWCFVVADSPGPDLAAALGEVVVDAVGKPFRLARVIFAHDFPKTASGKTVRRALRAVVIGESPGDTSTLSNPESLSNLAAAVRDSDTDRPAALYPPSSTDAVDAGSSDISVRLRGHHDDI